MDIVHHTLIGGSGFLVASAFDQPVAGAAFLLASVFPDLDVAFVVLRKRFYLRNHQAISHWKICQDYAEVRYSESFNQ